MSDHTTRALLVLTNSNGIDHLEMTDQWKHLALRADQLDIDQILFLDTEAGIVSHIAFLKYEKPFTAVQLTEGAPILYTPNIACVEDVLDIAINTQAMHFIENNLLGGSLTLDHEAATLEDIDGLFASDEDAVTDLLGGEIVDQLIENRRCFNQQAAIRYVKETPNVAIAQEQEGYGSSIPGDQMDELPEAWVAMGADDSLLALLNSAYDSIAVQ